MQWGGGCRLCPLQLYNKSNTKIDAKKTNTVEQIQEESCYVKIWSAGHHQPGRCWPLWGKLGTMASGAGVKGEVKEAELKTINQILIMLDNQFQLPPPNNPALFSQVGELILLSRFGETLVTLGVGGWGFLLQNSDKLVCLYCKIPSSNNDSLNAVFFFFSCRKWVRTAYLLLPFPHISSRYFSVNPVYI